MSFRTRPIILCGFWKTFMVWPACFSNKNIEFCMLAKTPKNLDRIDRKILIELQKDGRLSNVELAKTIGLSPSPCLERVRRLEGQGYITGYCALVDAEKLGAAMLVFVEITLTKTSVDIFAEFSAAVQQHEDIHECHLVSGNFDFLLNSNGCFDLSDFLRKYEEKPTKQILIF